MMDLSIIIVNYNTKEVTLECLTSIIEKTKGISFEIIVVDNGSKDGSVKTLKNFQKRKLTIIENRKNLGFGRANNQGIKKAKGRYVLLLNSDTLINSNLLKEMIQWMDKHVEAGIVSCALNNTDGSLQGTGGYFPTLIRVFSWMIIQDLPFTDKLIKPFHPLRQKSPIKGDGFYKSKRELDWVTGAFMLVRKEVLEQIGGFDEDYFMYAEDVDLCFRAKDKNWRVWYLPRWSIVHLGGASGSSGETTISEYKGVKLFYKKHYPSWQYPLLRLFLKAGALGRFFLFSLIEGKGAAKVYAKAFQIA